MVVGVMEELLKLQAAEAEERGGERRRGGDGYVLSAYRIDPALDQRFVDELAAGHAGEAEVLLHVIVHQAAVHSAHTGNK